MKSNKTNLFKLFGLVTDIYGISYKGYCISKKGYQLKTRDARELASAIVNGAKSWVQHEFTSKRAEFTSK
ncbi:hypothetical protein [Peribacillus simplex]|uniref:hypothetical protein n=1 Tax=Peribacillus simplex TaxID=1478 RepID=UPI000BA58DFA|nr:hypothetical protein [Peribacillus simplex]PAK38189.1 hypothetical protein CHI08_21325 [Peribacillus simplex]